MFRGRVNVAHKHVNAEVGAVLPRFLATAGRCYLPGQNAHDRLLRPFQGNILRRLLTLDEYDDIRHYEIIFCGGPHRQQPYTRLEEREHLRRHHLPGTCTFAR